MVQGLSATMTKIAMWILQNKIWDENLNLTINAPIHDELNCIGNKEHSTVIVNSMVEAGTHLCRNVPMDADCNVSNCWVH